MEEQRAEAPVQDEPQVQGQRRRRWNKPGNKNPGPRNQGGQGGADIFGPKHIAAPGPVKNDSLTDQCFFPQPGENLAPVVSEQEIYSGAEGLVMLSTTEYTALVAHAFAVKRSISLSGYCYYAACLTWARMLELNITNQGTLTFEERQFIDAMRRYRPPKILGAYLHGFGNTSFENGFSKLHFRLRKPSYHTSEGDQQFPGFFGTMQGNARFYASYPCLAVFAKRVYEDLRATHNRQDDVVWDLDEFSYPNRALTEACLGYAPAQRIDSSTVATYALAGITANEFVCDYSTLAVNFQLLNMVQLWVEEVRGVVLLESVSGSNGSTGQLLRETLVEARRTLSSSTWQATAPIKLNAGAEYAGSTFLYRVQKEYEGTGHVALEKALCPFAAATIQEVRVESLNFLRDAESDEMLGVENGISPRYNIPSRLRGFMASSIKAT